MSKIARKPIFILNNVHVIQEGNVLIIKSSKENLQRKFLIPENIEIELNEKEVFLKHKKAIVQNTAMLGTVYSNIKNYIIGLSIGFNKVLQLVGIGYRAQIKGGKLILSLGYSNPVEFDIPEGIEIIANSQTELLIKGYDKQLVGEVSAKIRSFRKPEPYKGKGIRYKNEDLYRKEVKKK